MGDSFPTIYVWITINIATVQQIIKFIVDH